jgi:Cu/Ag efflux pump CusA
MLKAIVAFSLRFRGIVIALACITFGYAVYSSLNAKLGVFPEFAPPQTMNQTEAPGLAPEQVEALVTQPIENALLGFERCRDYSLAVNPGSLGDYRLLSRRYGHLS